MFLTPLLSYPLYPPSQHRVSRRWKKNKNVFRLLNLGSVILLFDLLFLAAMNIGESDSGDGDDGGRELRQRSAKDAPLPTSTTGSSPQPSSSSFGCEGVAACIYFLVTSAFAWMLMEGLSQYQSLYIVFSTKEINKRFCALIGEFKQ